MRQNNNQQQNSFRECSLQLNEIQQTSLSQKVFKLQVQLQNTEKHYQSVKKPMKSFSKFKRSFNQSKDSKRNLQKGVLSQKIIPPNLGQNLQYPQKMKSCQNPRLKNVFEVYKQTLQQKYKKRIKQMQKSLLKINSNKIQENQTAAYKIISEKQEEIKVRLSHKKLDPTLILSLQTALSSNKRQSVLKSLRVKQTNSFQLQTIDESRHNFINSINQNKSRNKYSIACGDHLTSTHNQGNLYQIKRKCYTQQRQQEQNEENNNNDYNKTRNVSFKLPSERKKTHKHFIEKIGGVTYNLPHNTQKLNTSHINESLSYLVKSLRKPTMSQNSKQQRPNDSRTNRLHKFSENSRNQHKGSIQKYHTLSVQNQASAFTEDEIQHGDSKNEKNQNVEHNIKIKQQNFQVRHNKNKNLKLNLMEGIQGWNIVNQVLEQQNNFFQLNARQFHNFRNNYGT